MAVAALTLLLAGCGSSAGPGAAAAPTAAPAAPATEAPPTAAAAASVAAGPFPTPAEEVYQGCPPQGDGGDAQLNMRKNRIDTAAWQAVPLQDLLALTWPPGVEKAPRATWSSADAATVAQNEGRPVSTEGYVLKVRHEGPESPNCHDAASRDYHVWLAAAPAETRANAMVVELTPRVVARNPGWGTPTNLLRLAGHHVRIAGWLLLDQEHPEQLHRTRGTLWEIHPIMQVLVDQNGAWSDLASGSVTLGAARVDRSTGTDGQSGSSGGSGAYSGNGSSYPPTPTHHRRRRRR